MKRPATTGLWIVTAALLGATGVVVAGRTGEDRRSVAAWDRWTSTRVRAALAAGRRYVVPNRARIEPTFATDIGGVREAPTHDFGLSGNGVMPRPRPRIVAIVRRADGCLHLSQHVSELFRNRADQVVRGLAWDQHERGVRITRVRRGSLADQVLTACREAGETLLQEGDVVVRIGGVSIRSKAQAISHVRRHPVAPGEPVVIEVLRGGALRRLRVAFAPP